jgi:hypothetical protein
LKEKLLEDTDVQFMVLANQKIRAGEQFDPEGLMEVARVAANAAEQHNRRFTASRLLEKIGERSADLDQEAAARGAEAAAILDIVVEELLGLLTAGATAGASLIVINAGHVSFQVGTKVLGTVVRKGARLVITVGKKVWHVASDAVDAIHKLVRNVLADLVNAGKLLSKEVGYKLLDRLTPELAWAGVVDEAAIAASRGESFSFQRLAEALSQRLRDFDDQAARAIKGDPALKELQPVSQIARSHDVGVQLGRKYVTSQLGLKETNWVNPFGSEYSAPGFDDIMEDVAGNLWIVEYKGGPHSQLDPGQMELPWVRDNIKKLIDKGDPFGAKLQDALDKGRLRGIAVQSTEGPRGITREIDQWLY